MAPTDREADRELPDAGLELLDRFSEDVRAVVLGLRARVLGVAPSAHELIVDVGYTVTLRYGPDEGAKGAFVYIAGFSKHANLGILEGASLPDPADVLRGDGAQMRHVKFGPTAELDAPWLGGYLEAALRQAGLDGRVGDAETTVRSRTDRPTRAARRSRPMR
jgi:hypothetical protein